MNTLPDEPHAQPLDIDLIHEEYDNIEINRFYYVRQRGVSVSMDYVALVMNKGSTTIALDIKKYRFTETGPDWIDVEADAQDVRTFERDDDAHVVHFYRPTGTEPAGVETESGAGAQNESESTPQTPPAVTPAPQTDELS
ncbi:MAG: hypothetical protein F2563_05935 [Actinobacteria bacterium]|uniref:Unannotated protein n=1 Tax=freshwater metagenome TaxID=449393 RepID=A0A6J6F7U2_9ZZZZ|nr:hypothetical protein [Actinomycetota bacterium]